MYQWLPSALVQLGAALWPKVGTRSRMGLGVWATEPSLLQLVAAVEEKKDIYLGWPLCACRAICRPAMMGTCAAAYLPKARMPVDMFPYPAGLLYVPAVGCPTAAYTFHLGF